MNYLDEDLYVIAEDVEKLRIKNSSVLITGATGLIGSLLVKALLRANEKYGCALVVKAVCRSKRKAWDVFGNIVDRNDFYLIIQDVMQPFCADANADYIIHAASPTVSGYFMSNPVETLDTICQGSKNVLELAKNSHSKGMVYLSSMEVFGAIAEQGERINEKQLGYLDIGNIRSCYSEGKRLVECMCKCYSEEYGIPVKIARLAQTFGAGISKNENRVFAQFARSAVKGMDIVLHTTGESIGNYCYTRDAIKAVLLLLRSGENGEPYTIVNERSTMSIADMAKLVADNFSNGASKVIFDIPEKNEFGYAPVTKMRLSSKKMCDLGWKPEVDIIESYKRMLPYL